MNGAISSPLSRETLTHAFSGAIAGVTAVSVFYPLETVRTRKQVNSDSVKSRNSRSEIILVGLIRSLTNIYAKEGVRGLYKGYSSVVMTLFCGNFLYFYSYVYLQTVFNTSHSKNAIHSFAVGRNSVVDLLVAFLAGCFNVFATTPLWVANTRLKLQGVDDVEDKIRKDKVDSKQSASLPIRLSEKKYSGLVDALVTIAKEEGLPSLYSGTLPSLILVLNPALQWTIYEFLKLHCQKWNGIKQLSALAYFLLSAIAKFCSTTATYPLQVIQTRSRFKNTLEDSHTVSLTQMLQSMFSEEGGSRGLFRGLESKIVQTVLTSAFMIVVYEKMVTFALKNWLMQG